MLAARDTYIGWTELARRTNLNKVLCNARFLIVPSVKVPNLASHALSLALDRLPYDWEERYAIRPVLVETFVDPTRFDGICYKAANWIIVGDSSGRRDGIAKRIFLRPLYAGWHEVLCDAVEPKLGTGFRVETPASWAEEEFGSVRLFDPRLKRRLYTIAEDFYNNCEKSIPEACGSNARTIGAYRFFQNEAVSMDVLLTAHTEATIERIKEHSVVLAPLDTTTLDYNTHPMTEGLGPTSGEHSGGLGLIMHDTVAFTDNGTPLGVIDAQCWARDPENTQKSKQRKSLPIEQKESIKWLRSFQKVAEIQKLCPDTMLISTGDRESDIYELLQEATKDPKGPKLLIRAEKTRNRKVEQEHLWEHMIHLDIAGMLKIHIPRRGSTKARDALVELRFAEVELTPPERLAKHPAITVWAVYLRENPDTQDSTDKIKPIEWMLLTTVPVHTLEDAKTRVEWYSGRWGIEVYHRSLKSGCRIRDRQLETADRLEACIGIDMVVAWRIYHLTMLGRETPDVPCTVFFNGIEWKALCLWIAVLSVCKDQV